MSQQIVFTEQTYTISLNTEIGLDASKSQIFLFVEVKIIT